MKEGKKEEIIKKLDELFRTFQHNLQKFQDNAEIGELLLDSGVTGYVKDIEIDQLKKIPQY